MELYQALKKTRVNTPPPGSDGLTYEFYKTFWDFVKMPLLEAMNDIFSGQGTLDNFCEGIILIPKSNPERITDYRPITLLNTD